jgi:uncharacterized membrane protein YeaQ/YmgE (transglycosylase-associated protein family)
MLLLEEVDEARGSGIEWLPGFVGFALLPHLLEIWGIGEDDAMTFTSLQLAVLGAGILGLLLGIASGILVATATYGGGAVTLALSVIGWLIVYGITARRSRRA